MHIKTIKDGKATGKYFMLNIERMRAAISIRDKICTIIAKIMSFISLGLNKQK